MVVQLYGYTKTHCIVYCERVTVMVLNFISIKLFFKFLAPSLTNYATLHKSFFFSSMEQESSESRSHQTAMMLTSAIPTLLTRSLLQHWSKTLLDTILVWKFIKAASPMGSMLGKYFQSQDYDKNMHNRAMKFALTTLHFLLDTPIFPSNIIIWVWPSHPLHRYLLRSWEPWHRNDWK